MKKQGNFLMKVSDLIGLTLLWVVGCIPVVTFLTSTAAMYHVAVTCIREGKVGVAAEFKAAYLKNLKQGICLTLIFAAAGALLGAGNYFVFGVNTEQSSEMMILMISTLIVTVVFLLLLLWMIPVLAKKTGKIGELMKEAYRAATKNLGKGLLMFWIVFAVVLAIRIFIPLVIVLPAASMLWISRLTEQAID